MTALWCNLLGGGNGSDWGWNNYFGGSNSFCEKPRRKRDHCKPKKKDRCCPKPCPPPRKECNDICDQQCFETRLRQKVVVKIMKPQCTCARGSHGSDSCDSESTCEELTMYSGVRVPVKTSIYVPECVGC